MPSIPRSSVQLVVTSPPFLDIVQGRGGQLAGGAGLLVSDATSVAMAIHRTEAAWQDMVRNTLTERARVVAPGGHVAFEAGEVATARSSSQPLVWEAAEDLPFDRLFVMFN